MSAVSNVAANGRTVMVTIHQPSIEIFESFDRLVLLGMGGEGIFVGNIGHESRDLIDYFQVCLVQPSTCVVRQFLKTAVCAAPEVLEYLGLFIFCPGRSAGPFRESIRWVTLRI